MIRKLPSKCFSLLVCSVLFAVSISSYAELDDDSPDLGGGVIEAAPWKEAEVVIPPYPAADDLIKVEVDRVDMPFSFYLDSKNITSSVNDDLIRYTVVIESNSGAKNVLFEGIRCQVNEYKTYAYGTYDNKFVKARTSSWQRILDSGFMAHRYNFYKYYMCNDLRVPNPVSEILRKIRYPEDFQVSGDESD